MRYVVLGYIGFGNAGDEAVLACIVESLAELDPECEIVAVSGDPKATTEEFGIRAIGRLDICRLAIALARADVLISGGGSLFQDITSPRPPLYYGAVSMMALMLGTPYVVYAQGIGPLRNGVSRRIVSQVMTRARYVSLRDFDSLGLLRSLSVTRPIEVVADPALTYHADTSNVPTPQRRRIALVLRDWPSVDTLVDGLLLSLDALREPVEVVIVPFHATQDEGLAQLLADRLDDAVLIPGDMPVAGKAAWIASSSLAMTMRLHGAVLAAAAGVPFVALSYDPKVSSFAKTVGQPIGAILGQPFDPEVLKQVIQEQLACDLTSYRERVTSVQRLARVPAAATVALAERQRARRLEPR